MPTQTPSKPHSKPAPAPPPSFLTWNKQENAPEGDVIQSRSPLPVTVVAAVNYRSEFCNKARMWRHA